MHVTHIVSTYPPYKGGMGNVAARYVQELQKRGHEIRVLTPQYKQHEKYDQDGAVIRVPSLFEYGNSAFVPKMYSMLDSTDLIHLHYPFFGGAELVAWYKMRHPEKPLILSYHMDTIGSGAMGAFFTAYRYTCMPFILKQANTILVSSLDYAHSSFLHRYFSKLRIEELPFGISDLYTPDPTKKAESNQIKLLFVGGLDKAHYFKGLDVLIDALSLLKHKSQREFSEKIHLTIVGDGQEKGAYMQKVRAMGLTNSISFAGKLSEHDLIKQYQSSTCTILPSTDRSEAFGLVLIESMACGTPVIASNLPGVRSVVDTPYTGMLIEPKDVADLALALEELTNKDAHVIQTMGEAATKRVNQRYRWPAIIDKLEAFYKELV